MEFTRLKKQQIYLMNKVNTISEELLNVMELLDVISQIIEPYEEEETDTETDTDDDIELLETNSDEN